MKGDLQVKDILFKCRSERPLYKKHLQVVCATGDISHTGGNHRLLISQSEVIAMAVFVCLSVCVHLCVRSLTSHHNFVKC